MRLSFSVRRLGRARARLGCERGVTLIETVVTMIMLTIVFTTLSSGFVSSSHAELDLNRRFRAQEKARLALDKLRREIHCAKDFQGPVSASTIVISLPSYCQTGSASLPYVMWCVNGSALYRFASSTIPTSGSCTAGTKWADSLVSSTWFSYSPPPPGSFSLATLHVDLPVNLRQNATLSSPDTFDLSDDIALRNWKRS
jgi:type II secretory pathway pseudopilin PulG